MRIEEAAKTLVEKLKARGVTVATAESCTGGGIGQALTSVPGSSAVYLGGVISYTNQVKEQLLGVSGGVLAEYGAVSARTASAMAEGVRRLLGSDLAISVTGLAGPDSDGSGKPVGLVYIGVSQVSGTEVQECRFSGDREAVRGQAVKTALLFAAELG